MLKKWWELTRQFLVEVKMELFKTTWPGRKEVWGTTLVVIVMTIICAVFLWGVDWVLQPVVTFVYPTQ